MWNDNDKQFELSNVEDQRVIDDFKGCRGKCKGHSLKSYTVKMLKVNGIIRCASQVCENDCEDYDVCEEVKITINS